MHGIRLVIGIILARLLLPAQFGLIGMTAIFTGVARSFVDSGFSQALIRKKTCTQSEYSTVFYYNLLAAAVLYVVLFFSASQISKFFNEPQLIDIIRVIGLTLIVLALSQIQRTILIRNIDFKRLTIITIIATALSGGIAIVMALSGYGVWSLVLQLLIMRIVESILLWSTSYWKPSLVFSVASFRELFSFGGKMLASGLLNTVWQNVYNLVIGRYFSAADLGFYTRARRFGDLVGRNINSIVQNVTFPVLASIGDDDERLKRNYRRLLMATSLISCYLSLTMAACAESMIIGLIGPQWEASIPYLQLLCFSGMLYPMQSLNLNILKIKGRSDLFLKLEIIKKILLVPVIIIGIQLGILPMLFAVVAISFISYFLNSYYSGELISYPTFEQIKNIAPSFLIAFTIALVVYLLSHVFYVSPLIMLVIQVAIAAAGGIIVCTKSKYPGAIEIRQVVALWIKRLLKDDTA
jgi:O-antigen/teichoic acid export membrane protein